MTTAAGAPRIQPGDRLDLGLVNWAVAVVSGRVAGTGPPNVFRVLGRNRRLYRGWLHFAGRLMPGGRLPRRETELVILRVAHLAECPYEFEHHTRLARRAGVRPDEIEAVIAGPDRKHWSERERTILTTVDELHHERDLDDATWRAVREHLDEETAIELLLLVGHYEMLATTINTLRIPHDEPRAGR